MKTGTEGIFNRTARLVGQTGMARLAAARVLLVGTGGVGSWCAESLVRSGIMHLTIVDSDLVCASNLNRQLMATTLTLGQPKVQVLAERLRSINPEAQIMPIVGTFSAETLESFNLSQYDVIIDAIDSIPDKALLLIEACKTDARVYSSMGAALKLDPSRIAVTEFWKVHGCPLARALRNRFRKTGQFPSRKIKCVYSDELLSNVQLYEADASTSNKTDASTANQADANDANQTAANQAAANKADVANDQSAGGTALQAVMTDAGNGSIVHITAIFGFTLAAQVFNDLLKD